MLADRYKLRRSLRRLRKPPKGKPHATGRGADSSRAGGRDVSGESTRGGQTGARGKGARGPAAGRPAGDAGDAAEAVKNLLKATEASFERYRRRESAKPDASINSELPIAAHGAEIVEAIRTHQVVVLSGATGSGKTTQIPQFCLEAGRGVAGKIACTQPRRIAAISVAERIAEELGDKGSWVGHKIRFDDRSSDENYIKILTDGMLLAETQEDPWLNEYDTIIIDEAHERSLNIDFILGIVKRLLARRSDLKLLITSATIDTKKFSEAFGDAPIIEVSGRLYPVEIRYRPPEGDDDELSYPELATEACADLLAEGPGDILVFMPTEQDIRETCDLLEGRRFDATTVLPLYARLSGSAQQRIFAAVPGRKIVVATNIAETSITIPGIRYVVDSGVARISEYHPGSRTKALPIKPVSRSSADQRAGRCGRVRDGICVRLYEEQDYESRGLYTPPEILRTNLAEVILRMLSLGIGDIEAFPFIDKPSTRTIQDGFRLLFELGAIREKRPAKTVKNARGLLSAKGRVMARLPIDPELARMLLEADERGCLHDVLVVASALTIPDPRERPAESAGAADQKQARFNDPASDFVAYVKLWDAYERVRRDRKASRTTAKVGAGGRPGARAGTEGGAGGKGGAHDRAQSLRSFCKEHFLSFRRMREWRDIYNQVSATLAEFGYHGKKTPEDTEDQPKNARFSNHYAAMHKAILSGLLSNVAFQKEGNLYQATGGRVAMVFPGSGLFGKAGEWIVAAEMVRTSRLFARTVATIEPEWLEEVGRHLCSYSYAQPIWAEKPGRVMAQESVSLLGLPIIKGRSVPYGNIDPKTSSDIFIREALVGGRALPQVLRRYPFLQHNRELVEGLRNIEDKVRRRDLLRDDDDLFEFYRSRLPEVYDFRLLDRFLKEKGSDEFLRMTEDDVLDRNPEEDYRRLYPDVFTIGDTTYTLEYSFDPGESVDGVTLLVPAEQARDLPTEELEWLVPGLRSQKVEAILRALPKEHRRKISPVAEAARVVADELATVDGGLIPAIRSAIYRRYQVNIPVGDFDIEAIPEYLRMRIAVVDPEGKEVMATRDPAELRGARVELPVDPEFDAGRKKLERRGVKPWDFGPVERRTEIRGRAGRGREPKRWTVYPALARRGDSVDLTVSTNEQTAGRSHIEGVAMLYRRHFATQIKAIQSELAFSGTAKRAAMYYSGGKTLLRDLWEIVGQKIFTVDVRDADAFFAHAKKVSGRIYPTATEVFEKVSDLLTTFYETKQELFKLEKQRQRPGSAEFLKAMHAELERILPPDFLLRYPERRLPSVHRYLRAVAVRARKGLEAPIRDKEREAELASYMERLDALRGEQELYSEAKREALVEIGWMIEDYRVSLFAQELGTRVKVSPKRLRKAFEALEGLT